MKFPQAAPHSSATEPHRATDSLEQKSRLEQRYTQTHSGGLHGALCNPPESDDLVTWLEGAETPKRRPRRYIGQLRTLVSRLSAPTFSIAADQMSVERGTFARMSAACASLSSQRLHFT